MRTVRWSFGAVLVLLLLVLVFPYLAAVQPFRNMMLRAVLPVSDGTVSASRASLGWFSPIEFHDIEVDSSDGTTVMEIPVFKGDRALWRYIVSPSNLGDFRIERPRLNVVATEDGSNVRQVFAVESDQPAQRAAPPDISVGVEIVDASLAFRSRDALQPWHVEGFNLSLALRSSETSSSGQTELVVRPGTVFNRTPITPQMCDDLLKYIAPVLAGVADTSGEFTIELERCHLPAANPAQGEGSGRLVIHAIDVGPGPLVRRLAPMLQLQPSIRLADNSVVEFTMAGGRVHHQGLVFGVGQLNVRTSGSVGLDESLDLIAEIPIPAGLLGETPLAGVLRDRTVKLPIRGTLDRPQIDPAALGTSNADLLLGTLQQLLRNRPAPGQGLLDLRPPPQRPRGTPLLDLLRQGMQRNP